MHAYGFLGLHVSPSLGVHGQVTKVNSETCLKTAKGLKERISRVCLGKKPMFPQHDDARTLTGAGTSVAIQGVGLEVVLHPPYSLIWHRLTSGCLQHSRNLSKEFMLHVMKKFKLLPENGFENSPKNSTRTGSKKLFSAGGVVSNERDSAWKSVV